MALALLPVAGHPYDIAALTAASEAWLRWGTPLFHQWKFGLDLALISVSAQALRFVLTHVGMGGAAAVLTAWKLPLVIANILVGLTLLDLGRRLRVRQPSVVPVLWLLSPVSVWVAAGHGQVEPLTVLAIVLGLDLLVRRHPAAAGLVTGLGIGVEYLPAIVAVVTALLVYNSVLKVREGLSFALGIVVAVAACFVPGLLSPVGRASLFSGLSSTASVASHPGTGPAAPPVSASVWTLVGVNPGSIWVALALLAGGALVATLAWHSRAASYAVRERAGVLATGGLLLIIVLLDPGGLPQFADLTLGGLCLVALVSPVGSLAIMIGPALQVASAFLFVYGGSFQSYWYNMWATTGNSGWPFPESAAASVWLLRLSVLVVLAGLAMAAARRSPPIPNLIQRASRRSSIVLGVIGLVFIGTWSSQPAFWSGVGTGGPQQLADFTSLAGTVTARLSTSGRVETANFTPPVIAEARTIGPQVPLALQATLPAFHNAEAASSAEPAVHTSLTVRIQGWPYVRANMSSLWVNILLGQRDWSTPSVAHDAPVVLLAGKCSARPAGSTLVSPGWAVYSFTVSSTCVPPAGTFLLRVTENSRQNTSLLWNGSGRSPWSVVYPHTGSASVVLDRRTYRGTFTTSRDGWGAGGIEQVKVNFNDVSLTSHDTVANAMVGGIPATVEGISVHWPSGNRLDHWTGAPALVVVALLYVGGLAGLTFIVWRWLALGPRRRSHVRASAA